MSTAHADPEIILGPESAGILMTPEEFDAVEEYDECYTYELIHGVLVVNPIPSPEETGPNELLGHLLWEYQQRHNHGRVVDDSLPQQYVRTSTGWRIADRLIWTGLGRIPNVKTDPATIAIEFVSAGRRNRRRDYEEKRQEYGEASIREYWIFDRFRRTLTVVAYSPSQPQETVIPESQTYESPLLPGFVVPLDRILQSADRRAGSV
jgi:Uma2 family endonuclease